MKSAMDSVFPETTLLPDQGILIGLGHKYGSGKDTLADFYVQKFGFVRMAFADTLKEACRVVFGFTDAQLYGDEKSIVDPFWDKRLRKELAAKTGKDVEVTPGYILQLVGTQAFRNYISPDIWILALERQMEKNPNKNYVLSDPRFPNENHFIKQRGGLVARIDRKDRNMDGRDPNHASETALDGYTNWDYVIDNNSSLEDLYRAGLGILEDHGWVEPTVTFKGIGYELMSNGNARFSSSALKDLEGRYDVS